MILFPKPGQLFVQLSDPQVGTLDIHSDKGLPVSYPVGVYVAHKYPTIISFQMEGEEVVGPTPDGPINSPGDVVLPDAMLKKAPKAPKAAEAPKAPTAPPAEEV
jgi:hypothetical protein